MPCPSTRSPRDPHPRALPPRAALALAAALATLGARAPARAADGEDTRQAQGRYRSGEEAFRAGRYDEAYQHWEAGYQLSQRPLFLLDMAHAERRRGELRAARALYQRYLLVDPRSRLRAEVEAVLAELDAALGDERAVIEPAEAAPASAARLTGAAAVVPPPLPATPWPAMALPPPRPRVAIDLEAGTRRARPLYQRWWFWTGVGGVVAAGAAAIVLASGGPSYARRGSLGTVGRAP